MQRYVPGVKIERARLRWNPGIRQNDVSERIGAEAIFAFVQPDEAANAEPATVGFQACFVVAAPFFDGGAI